ncbi:Precorrin-8X methylmutase [Synechococcus moorigangaii CMS01]|nr:Precorrin-8X methylmutase [Synechococcus moorigangaii CMS01]
MEWHISDAQSLAIIDREIGQHSFSPAEYEIVRQVIYQTADFEYAQLIRFSDQALQAGAAALAARSTIVVDMPMVRVGITENLQSTFANPVYCSVETLTRPQRGKTKTAWGIETLGRRYPEAIFIIGQSQTALSSLVGLVKKELIRPALVILTPANFLVGTTPQHQLDEATIPYIGIHGRKGGAMVAVAIMNSLISLSWQAYGQDTNANP